MTLAILPVLCVLADGPQVAPGVPANAAGLSEDELARRREALATWTNEPVALEGHVFLFHLDRRDGSFFFQDRRTQVKWFSSWGRRGFASVRVRSSSGEARWLCIDRVDSLTSEEKWIRFRGASSAGEAPHIRFAVEALGGSAGVAISCEVADEDRARVDAVRLLDGAFWIADADKGGAALPAGMGEWHAADDPGPLRRRLEGLGPAAPAGAESFALACLPLLKLENPILLGWNDPSAAIEVVRRDVPGESFPGRAGLFVTLEFAAPKGRLEIRTLGKEQGGVVDAARAHRESLGQAIYSSTLRTKTGQRPELRALLGAALFRVEVGANRTFADVATLAERFKNTLEIGDAAFILAGWGPAAPSAGGAGSTRGAGVLPAPAEAGGNEGLKACAKGIRDLGYIFGLEVDAARLRAAGEPATATLFWREALEAARREENLPALLDLCAPQLVVVREPASWPAGARPAEAMETRADFYRHVRDTFGLAGANPGSGADIEHAAILEGLLSSVLRNPTAPEAWPLFTAAFGHCVRITCDPRDAVRPDQPEAILAHLLAGEAPMYVLAGGAPLPAAGDPRLCLAREDGWAAGKGLSPHEIFIKNTYEVLSDVSKQARRDSLFFHRKLNAAGTARESYFGVDLRVVVNFGPGNYEDEEEGFVLPPMGFFVRYPFFRAFHALRMNDVEYERPACFVMRSLEGKMILRAEAVKIIHLFGPDTVQFGGKAFKVEREAVVKFW